MISQKEVAVILVCSGKIMQDLAVSIDAAVADSERSSSHFSKAGVPSHAGVLKITHQRRAKQS